MSGTPTPRASSLARMTGTARAAASLLTVIRTSSEPACASWATWMAVASASAVSVFVIDWTTTGWADPTGTPPTSTVGVVRRGGTLIAHHGRASHSDGHSACTRSGVTERLDTNRARARQVWIVEDEPASATLAAELCETWGAHVSVFRAPLPFLSALRDRSQPMAVVLDWRLEHELSAPLFLATRHRYPRLPVIYWTGHFPG